MRKIIVFGDSHAAYFQPTPKVYQHAPFLRERKIEVHRIHAASLIGLGRPGASLGTHEKILSHLDDDSLLAFAFGQVDMELGYYYRRVIKKEPVEREAFAQRLLTTYRDYLLGLGVAPERLLVKGLNLTVLKSPAFALEYVKRIVTENRQGIDDMDDVVARLREAIEPFAIRNAATLRFNALLESLCRAQGWRYFDVNHQICAYTPANGIADQHVPVGFDHHLVDSVEVRKIHIAALLNAAGRAA